MGRPAKKRTYVESKAKRRGELQAEYEFKKAHSIIKKPMDFLEDTIKKTIDKIDVFETAAILGTTFIVHGVIITSTELLEKVEAYQHQMPEIYKAFPELEKRWKFEHGQKESLVTTATNIVEGVPDYMVWLVSFTLAYIIIKHAGSLVGLLDKGITSVVPMLLGVAT